MVGRLWDVFSVMLAAIRNLPDDEEGHDRCEFTVSVLVDGRSERKEVQLYSVVGPGDDAEPVITIMLPDED